MLDQAEHLYNGAFSPNVRPIAARKVRIWVAQGQLDKALGWAREQELSTENELSYIHEFDLITLGQGAPGRLSERPGQTALFKKQSVCWSAC